MKNSIGREVPETLGSRILTPFQGAFATTNTGLKAARPQRTSRPGQSKLINGLDAALEAVELKDGMTLGFHHCFRDGDFLVNQVLDAAARRGVKGLRLVPSALFPVHAPIIEHIKSGVVDRIEGSLNGPVGRFVSQGGKLAQPGVLRSHGGRWRAIESGTMKIDVAFVAAPQADPIGNATGVRGKTPCGPIGYSKVDAQYADKTVVVTNDLAPYPLYPAEIQHGWVDYVCLVDQIGDPNSIASGTLQLTKSPTRLKISRLAALAVKHSGRFQSGMGFQGGAGGVSLAATKMVCDELAAAGLQAGFAIGGITKVLVEELRKGTVRTLLDVQSFDLDAVESMLKDPGHIITDVGEYANYDSGGCATYQLDAAFLGATEVDLDFNVNVNTHSDGLLLHGIGGHQDVAAGAWMTVITTPALRGRLPVVVDRVTTVTTPGEVIDVIATEYGLAVNPRREDLKDRFLSAGLPVVSLEEIKSKAERLIRPVGRPIFSDEIIALIEWRDGTVLDAVRRVEGWE